MEREWVKIFETPDIVKIELARLLLEKIEIDSVIIDKRDRTYGFGDSELYVHRDFVIKAKQALKEL
jgi:hypothetical protein